MRAIGYLRVSTEEQARDGASVAAQRAALIRYADANGISIVHWAEDLGVSAAVRFEDRPAGQGAFALLARRGADAVLCTAVDRVFRNVREGLGFIDWAKPRGIRLVSLRETIDTGTATGRFALTVTLGTAELERNLIAERTSQAMQQMRREGRFTGTAPFGTVRADAHGRPTADGDYLARDPATWATRQQVVDLYRHGLPDGRRVGFGKLSLYLRFERALPAPGGGAWWSKATLKSLHDTHDLLSQLPLAAEVATATTP
jgi:DNA invertase Pin-like site-specific DNA recombinase